MLMHGFPFDVVTPNHPLVLKAVLPGVVDVIPNTLLLLSQVRLELPEILLAEVQKANSVLAPDPVTVPPPPPPPAVVCTVPSGNLIPPVLLSMTPLTCIRA